MAVTWTAPVSLPSCPQPGGNVSLREHLHLPWLAAMADTPQDPEHHGEGDVLTHTEMVCRELVSDPAWAALDIRWREELWWAAMLHDTGKPRTTRVEDGRLRAPGHARAGALIARRVLWQAGVDPVRRERVCGLVRWHMTPYHLLDRPDPLRAAIELAQTADPRLLRLLVQADSRGRVCADAGDLADRVALNFEYLHEAGVGQGPYPFASDHARFCFFRSDGRDPAYAAHDDTRCTVTILSGLPGAGKDRWCDRHADGAAIVSLDALRRERGARRGDRRAQGQVKQQALEMLRAALRDGRDAVWNTTGLSRQLRGPIVDLARAYRARVRIVCAEADPATLYRQNRDRPHPVDPAAIDHMLERWEYPDLTECHTLERAADTTSFSGPAPR